MKIVIAGGSGQVGQVLARVMTARGDDVVILSRGVTAGVSGRVVPWDSRTLGAWVQELDGADAVINLAGRNVNCRYSAANRREILTSRVESTRVVGQALAGLAEPPPVWLQASTATIYAHRFDAANDEASGIIGGHEPDAPASWRFSIEVATAWERELAAAPTPRTRRVALRTSMVMSPDRGGIFDTLLAFVRHGLGGKAGTGRQFISWIHDCDFTRAIDWVLARQSIEGPVNITAPCPLPNEDFMRELRLAWGMRIGLPAPAWLLSVGAFFMRTETELPLKSRRVAPGRLVDGQFSFMFPEWPAAARDLCARWRHG